jgi:type III secretion system FlhB-like substrate exporter
MNADARYERNASPDVDASRAPALVAQAVDEAIVEARRLAAEAELPLEGGDDTLALLSACDVDDELDMEACEVLAQVLRWLDQVEARPAAPHS